MALLTDGSNSSPSLAGASPARSQLVPRNLLWASVVPGLAGVLLLASSNPDYWRHACLLTWYALALALAGKVLGLRPGIARATLVVAALNLVVLTPEVFLRLAGFRYETGIQFGYPRPSAFARLVTDDDLFWKLPPSTPGVNSLGFRGAEIEVPKPAGTFRVLMLGDSVPHQGVGVAAEALLHASHPELGCRFVDLTQSGYSSHQGRILVEQYGTLLEPDLAVVSYGWNDHWLARGATDSQKQVSTSRLERWLQTIHRHSRLLQVSRYLVRTRRQNRPPTLQTPRVPLEDYRHNVGEIARSFTDRGIPVLFLTPPSSHERSGVPNYLIAEGFAVSKESVVSLHRSYNQILRQVVPAHGGQVLDLASMTAAQPHVEELFLPDGIHLSEKGLLWVAHHLAAAIRQGIREGRDRPPTGHLGSPGSKDERWSAPVALSPRAPG